MRNEREQPKTGAETSTGSGGLLIDDLVKYLARQGRSLADQRTGNPDMSDALRRLAEVLKPHRKKCVKELSSDLLSRNIMPSRQMSSPRRPAAELPRDLRTLSNDELNRILDDEKYLKKQLVELGSSRFGIPCGQLSRQTRPEAIKSIRAALDHERSLAAISHQAKLAGERRAS